MAIIHIVAMPETHIYKTDIVIGTQAQLIQSPEAIAANLDNAIIPKILRQQHIAQPE